MKAPTPFQLWQEAGGDRDRYKADRFHDFQAIDILGHRREEVGGTP